MAKAIITALFGFTALLFGCTGQNIPQPTTTEERIVAALQEVLQRDDFPFATIEHQQSGKAVQFLGSRADPLVLYLPDIALSSDELNRASELFASLGGTHVAGDANIAGGSFELDLGRDEEAAARAALRVLREVFLLPDDAELVTRVDS